MHLTVNTLVIENQNLFNNIVRMRPMPISLRDSLAVFGNSNHFAGFLKYYETEIEKRCELEKSLAKAPNYYAWIHIAAEQVFYSIREMIYINDKDEKAFDLSYKSLLNSLFSKSHLSREQVEAILLFAKIRHLLVHKGFPNPHVLPAENEREIANGYSFNVEEVQKIAEMLSSPKCFSNLKSKFSIAMKAISSIEQEFDHVFPFMRISKKKG